jgi:hypothetical protein
VNNLANLYSSDEAWKNTYKILVRTLLPKQPLGRQAQEGKKYYPSTCSMQVTHSLHGLNRKNKLLGNRICNGLEQSGIGPHCRYSCWHISVSESWLSTLL